MLDSLQHVGLIDAGDWREAEAPRRSFPRGPRGPLATLTVSLRHLMLEDEYA